MEETTIYGGLPQSFIKEQKSLRRSVKHKVFVLSKNNSILIDIISLFLAGLFFYQAIYKLVDLNNYREWLFYAPFVFKYSSALTYLIPISQIIISLLLLLRRLRLIMFCVVAVIIMSYIIYLIVSQQKGYLIMWLFEMFWFRPKWNLMILLNAIYFWIACKGILIQYKIISGSKK